MRDNTPTPGEIKQACERIRARWSKAEERQRRAWSVAPAQTWVVSIEAIQAAKSADNEAKPGEAV